MKKSALRAFGIACFVIGLLITISDKFNLPIALSNESNQEEQYKSKITQLEKQLKDANEQLAQTKQTEQPINEEAADNKLPEEKSTEVEKTAAEPKAEEEIATETLYIYEGLKPAEVAQKLKDLGVIKNSVEMELFLAQPEYATYLQKGQFKLNSSMSIEEIANIITGKSKTE